MSKTAPILLSFYGLSNGTKNLFMGQLSFSSLQDFSFKSFSARKTFRTILALYRTRFFAHQHIVLKFDHGSTTTTTDASGSFFCTSNHLPLQTKLVEIELQNGTSVRLVHGLYTCRIHIVESKMIVISDIDDTLMHSHISNKLVKFRTLMFTSMEKRKAVDSMRKLVGDLHAMGATPFYLSNSEQNLYPLIFRFLQHNEFPEGPLFLKQMRKVRHILRRIKQEDRDIHKTKMLEQILALYPDKKYFLLGDNTQNDLRIYVKAAEKYPGNIRYIIIREVAGRSFDKSFLDATIVKLQTMGIGFYYADSFPSKFDLH